jgi:hypothetical protein
MTINIWGGNHSQGLHNNFRTITKAKQLALEFLWQVTAVKFWEHFSDQNAKKYLSMSIFFFGLSLEKKSILQEGFQKEDISRSGT